MSFQRDLDEQHGNVVSLFVGCISSSSPTASPADVLIQASQTHRRARSAAWSYHFYPDEAWVDLTVQLPFAILLKEVQIQPHNASLTSKDFSLAGHDNPHNNAAQGYTTICLCVVYIL